MIILYGSAWRTGDCFPKVSSQSSPFLFTKWGLRSEWVDWVSWWKCTTSRECKTMIIAVSPVTDNSEQLDKDVDGKSPHSNFIIKFDGWTRVYETLDAFHGCVSYWKVENKMFVKSRTKLALCNSLQPHQPDKHVVLVLPFYNPP